MKQLQLLLIVPLLVVMGFVACSNSGGGPRCLASNCNGCCDANGECRPGNEGFACGRSGSMCDSCTQAEICALGQCVAGDGGTGGAGGAGGSGGNASCGPANCGGCCDNGTCRGGNTNMQCGSRGGVCGACQTGQSCQYSDAGTFGCAVFVCTGCTSTTGNCLIGTSAGACGNDGGMCRACLGGQSCVQGVCQAAATCSATTCAGGCCDGNLCVDPPTGTRCGRMGAACSACQATQVCAAGTCTTGGGTGGGSGGTGGGSGSGLCGPTSCANGCCDPLTGAICLPGTDNAFCGKGGGTCNICIPGLFSCKNQACSL